LTHTRRQPHPRQPKKPRTVGRPCREPSSVSRDNASKEVTTPTCAAVTHPGARQGFHPETMAMGMSLQYGALNRGTTHECSAANPSERIWRGLSPRATSSCCHRSPQMSDITVAVTSAGREPMLTHHISSHRAPPLYCRPTPRQRTARNTGCRQHCHQKLPGLQ
jgi:hypothetical protein